MIRRFLTYAAAAVLSFGVVTTDADARTFDLAFIMDESGSVGSTNYIAAMDSLADALETHIDAAVLADDIYNITVVSFADGANVLVSQTVDSLADLAIVTAAIRADLHTGGTTNFEAAFDALLGVGTALTAGADASIINMMTDGVPCCGTSVSQAGITGARNDLIGAGWDSLSFEAVGSGPDSTYLAGLGFDSAGTVGGLDIISDPNDIGNILTDPFVLEVSGFGTAYDTAIDVKVQSIVAPVPIPATLPLLAGGFALLGFVGRRRKS